MNFLQRIGLAVKSAANLTFDAINIAWYARHGYPRLYSLLGGGGPTWTGEPLSEATALNVSTVYACTRIIAETTAMLPLSLFRRVNGVTEEQTQHPLYRILHYEPNPEMTDIQMRETMTGRAVLRGHAYARIVRRSGRNGEGEILALVPLADVRRERKNGATTFHANEAGQEATYLAPEVFSLPGVTMTGDGYEGVSVLAHGRQSIAVASATDRYGAEFFANGGRVPYLIKMTQRFRNEQEEQRFAEEWSSKYANQRSFHVAPILQPGYDYQQIGISPEDAQFLQTRQFMVPEICRWFRVSPHMVADLSRATFSNIEHLGLEFVTYTLMPWLVRWEKAIWRCLLTAEEKAAGYFVKHNVSALLRGDFASRMQGYATALQNGHMSIDQVRALEDQNPLPNGAGQAHHIQLNMQTLPGTGQPTAAELSALSKAREVKDGA